MFALLGWGVVEMVHFSFLSLGFPLPFFDVKLMTKGDGYTSCNSVQQGFKGLPNTRQRVTYSQCSKRLHPTGHVEKLKKRNRNFLFSGNARSVVVVMVCFGFPHSDTLP